MSSVLDRAIAQTKGGLSVTHPDENGDVQWESEGRVLVVEKGKDREKRLVALEFSRVRVKMLQSMLNIERARLERLLTPEHVCREMLNWRVDEAPVRLRETGLHRHPCRLCGRIVEIDSSG